MATDSIAGRIGPIFRPDAAVTRDARMPVQTRQLYRSANGDRWLLARDADSDRVFVRHEANPSSGGHVTDADLGAFLSQGGHGPEQQELLRLIGSLIGQPAEAELAPRP